MWSAATLRQAEATGDSDAANAAGSWTVRRRARRRARDVGRPQAWGAPRCRRSSRAARRPQDRGEHVDGRRLAVGAGDREPGGRPSRAPHPPGELDLSPYGYAVRGRIERAAGGPGASPGEVTTRSVSRGLGIPCVLVRARRTSTPRTVKDLGALVDAFERSAGRRRRSVRGAALPERVGGGEPADAQAGDEHPQTRPVGVAMGQPGPL
jgi:hypothetical protein